MTALYWLVVAAGPIDRDDAREAARRELGKRIYQGRQAGWLERALEWIFDKLARAFSTVGSVSPGGVPGLLLLLLVAVALVVVLRKQLGPLRRRDLLGDDRGELTRSADYYRAEAAGFAAAGNWREALRARFRAVIRELEQRAILDSRAGRTAGEIAAEASIAMPSIAAPMRRAADVFNEIWYGDRPATKAAYDAMVTVDESVRVGNTSFALSVR